MGNFFQKPHAQSLMQQHEKKPHTYAQSHARTRTRTRTIKRRLFLLLHFSHPCTSIINFSPLETRRHHHHHQHQHPEKRLIAPIARGRQMFISAFAARVLREIAALQFALLSVNAKKSTWALSSSVRYQSRPSDAI